MLELPPIFQDNGFVLRLESAGEGERYALTWPRDTLTAARGAILVGLPLLFALGAPWLFWGGYWLEGGVNLIGGITLAVFFHYKFFRHNELLIGPRKLIQRYRWWKWTWTVEYDPAKPCRVESDGPQPDRDANVLACDVTGHWRSLYNDDHRRADLLCRWLNAVRTG